MLFVVLSTAAPASARDETTSLSAERVWIKLGRYEPSRSTPSGWLSAIHSESFFLSPDGRSNPLSELQATLAAFAVPLDGDPNQHAKCRFPARWLWLKARLKDHPALLDSVTCPAFDSWTRSGNVSSVSIVFATGYLGNPASFFGHTLLKLNFKSSSEHSRLMDVSVNYGAIVDQNDGPVTYIAKALTGGYDGGFSHIHYYFHNHNYAENELRDLWEYRLKLRQDQVDLVVAHAWELLGKRYTYEFFRNNCAYRMAEVVEIADGVQIIPRKWPWIIPQALTQELVTATTDEQPVLDAWIRTPSRQSRFYERYAQLSPVDADILHRLVNGNASLLEESFQSLPVESKQAILDALMDYYQFVGSPLKKAPIEIKQAYANALAARFAVEPGESKVVERPSVSPHTARPPGWIQAAAGHHGVFGNTLSLRVRPAYYDALDSDAGHVRNAALTMAELQVDVRPHRTLIRKFEIFGVDSANPGLTRLPGDDGAAWKVHVGFEQARLSCDDCVVGRIQGDIGNGRMWADGLFGAVYLGGALQSNRANHGAGFLRASADLVMRPRNDFGMKLSFERCMPFDSPAKPYSVIRAETRFEVANKIDFRINFERDDTRWVSIGIGRYW